ncbi:MAG: M15 family metallopeptidase [Clostridia bacterium]|nr:M15 family metallopeptidase [Clostridia bacterium]
MADERQNEQEFDDLLADFHIAQAKKAGKQAAAAQQETPKPDPDTAQVPRRPKSVARYAPADMPRKPDGSSYSIAELRQQQASRHAVQGQRTPYGELPAGKPLPARQDPRSQNDRARRQNAYEAAYRQQNPGQKKPVYRHRKANKPNGALVLFALLAIVVGGLSIHQIAQNRSEAAVNNPSISAGHLSSGDSFTGDPDAGAENLPSGTDASLSGGSAAETEEPAPEEMVLWNTTEVSNTQIDEGVLLLVNYQYPYNKADTIAVKDAYGNKNQYYQISSTAISLTDITLNAFNTMTEAFYLETGSDDMMIVSGYRNVQSQRDIYNDRVATQGEEMAALYVATPGHSEHHTGLAMDLTFYTDEGASVSIEEYEHGPWINEHCDEYGFVLRYPSDKVDITKIGYEYWHYRYVGVPHARIMSEKRLCLEEYITYIKDYTTDTKLLWIQKNGMMADVSVTALPSEGTLVYYVPMAEGETTEIKVPRGNIFHDTEISGNNVDGFIVTVHIGG